MCQQRVHLSACVFGKKVAVMSCHHQDCYKDCFRKILWAHGAIKPAEIVLSLANFTGMDNVEDIVNVASTVGDLKRTTCTS